MGSKTITVKLLEGAEVELTSDSPDLQGLVRSIVENRDSIDPEKISVVCDDEKFDSKGFSEIVSAATKAFLEELKIDKEKLNAALAEIEKKD